MSEGRSVSELVAALDPGVHEARPLGTALERVLVGSVEHTRAGFDLLVSGYFDRDFTIQTER